MLRSVKKYSTCIESILTCDSFGSFSPVVKFTGGQSSGSFVSSVIGTTMLLIATDRQTRMLYAFTIARKPIKPSTYRCGITKPATKSPGVHQTRTDRGNPNRIL